MYERSIPAVYELGRQIFSRLGISWVMDDLSAQTQPAAEWLTMAESIQCYQCGTRMTLEELVKNQDDCPECGAQHSLGDVAKALDLNTRAKQSSLGGEAVEVVAYRYTSSARLGGKWHYQESFPKWDDRKVSEIVQMDALMTVAQHNRIMAAATPADSRVVPVELLNIAAFHLENSGYTETGKKLRDLLEQNQ